MFRHYLKTALRNLWKRKSFSFINIVGLAIGMAVSFMILLYVWNEVTYDRFHEKAAHIFRLATKLDAQGRHLEVAGVPAPMGPALVDQFPEIIRAVRLREEGTRIVSYQDKLYEETKIYHADPALFEVFTIPVVRGNPETWLDAPFQMVLTDEMAEKYFGDDDPLGKNIQIDSTYTYTITGIAGKMPENSHFKFDMIGSLSSIGQIRKDLNMWMGFNYATYILTQGSPSVEEITPKVNDLLMANIPDQFKQLGAKVEVFLQPLRSIHLYSRLEGEMEPPGNPAFIRVLTTIALFILLIACINFMNLATAQSSSRAKEVGMRKVLGAYRGKLIGQYIGESLLLSFISLLMAIALIMVFLPVFNNLVEKELVFDPVQNGLILAGLAGITLLVGFLAGAYPAFFLSSFIPLEVLKSRFKAGKGHRFFRNGLVTLQYVISITLIISTLVIFYQLRHVKNRDLGFDKERVAVISLRGQVSQKHDVFKNEILRLPGVVRAAGSSTVPSRGRMETMFSFEGVAQEKQVFPIMEIDPDYLETMDMQVVEGRGFSVDHPGDNRSMILNETLVRQLGWEEPIGKTVSMMDLADYDDPEKGFIEVSYTVIGVVRDFHFASLHEKIRGHLMKMAGEANRISVKLRPEDIAGTLRSIQDIWQQLEPSYPFSYIFLDESFDRLYRSEQRMGQIFLSFTLMAIFISCLGLFGLASFTADQRTKEIGIRKVLGASVSQVTLLLSRDFTKWVILANVIAWPAAYLIMNKWLQGFAYRIDMAVWMFILSGATALLIALFTVGAKTIKAAVANPVDSLRYE